MGYRYTGDKLERETGNKRVRELVEWVTEPTGPDGKKPPWEVRNRNYLERIRKAPAEALTPSCVTRPQTLGKYTTGSSRGTGLRILQVGTMRPIWRSLRPWTWSFEGKWKMLFMIGFRRFLICFVNTIDFNLEELQQISITILSRFQKLHDNKLFLELSVKAQFYE